MVNDLPWFSVAPQICYRDIANLPHLCGDIEQRQWIRAYRGIIVIFNWRLNKEYLHCKSIQKLNLSCTRVKCPMPKRVSVQVLFFLDIPLRLSYFSLCAKSRNSEDLQSLFMFLRYYLFTVFLSQDKAWPRENWDKKWRQDY